MLNRHVEIDGATVEFAFRGKSGVRHVTDLHDRRVAAIIKRLRDLPGQHLFQYLDEDGELRRIESADVNEYLREITGQEFTAKDFRTWAGTLLSAQALQEFECVDSEAQAKKNVVHAIESVAQRLGNTPAVCRKCYIHPEIINAYLAGSTIRTVKEQVEQDMAAGLAKLSPEEAAVMALLHQRLAREERAK
jgi:DNA topoisomerase-1